MPYVLRTSLAFGALVALTTLAVAGCSGNADDLELARDAKKKAAAPVDSAATAAAPGAQPITPPAAAPDASVGACAPAPTAAVAVSAWRPPNPLHQPMCGASDIATIVNCYIGRDPNACNAPVPLTCLTCVVSDKTTAPAYGPIIFDELSPAAPELNVGGCVAAASSDPSPTGCGAKVAMAEGCAHGSCAACSADAQCLAAASAGSCAAQEQAARACGQQYLATCKPAGSPIQQAMGLAQLFCM